MSVQKVVVWVKNEFSLIKRHGSSSQEHVPDFKIYSKNQLCRLRNSQMVVLVEQQCVP